MSIPPLVCSTPPPPDQCEDDKEPEDFDIPYNLSQEDDDAYDYGNFSSFNHFSSGPNSKKDSVLLSNNIEALTISESRTDNNTAVEVNNIEKLNCIGTNITCEQSDHSKSDEETNIEDLNLEISDDPATSITKDDNELSNSETPENIINSENDSSELSLNSAPPSPCEENEQPSLHIDKEIIVQNVIETPYLEPKSSKSNEVCNNNDNDLINENVFETVNESKSNDLNDDFGDFDDFQFASDTKPATVEICDNPWESNDVETSDFGNFTAHFDDVVQETAQSEEKSPEVLPETQASNIDDDFGDFDDFKSSNVVSDSSEAKETDQVPVLNFQISGNENQIMESITKVLSNIFEEEITDLGYEYETKLESCLSVAWNHLKETDIRQPYMVNWNNSLGQKTLLKALCIDSRNILFGPKWSYNTPKFAANLSAAPLQPQKPLTPSTAPQSDVTAEKPAPKEGTWADPFTSDGQESCNNENEPPVQTVPSNFDMFGAPLPPKTEKIYSSTLNVQPLRQINLPDTHIFTPTDSETPRSKTIHYDRGPPILLPQTVIESAQKIDIPPPQQNKEEDDYWEFQDFKGTSEVTAPGPSSKELPDSKPESAVYKPNVTYQTQVLQPIKMEPLMPTLNWPDPGEVKETFEDFSDFISNSTLKSDNQISVPEVKNDVETNFVNEEKHYEEETKSQVQLSNNAQDFDDDFDTFQSALPTTKPKPEFTFNSLPTIQPTNTFENIPNHPIQTQSITTDFEYAFPKLDKSENTSGNSLTLGISTTTDLTPTKSTLQTNPIPANLLQPLPASTVKPQKTGQILQPLSLESYSQINWPNPGFDLQDLSRFNPVETLQSLKTDLSVSGSSKGSPAHSTKANNQADDDIWGEFISSKPKQQVNKKPPVFADDDEWTDFVSSTTVKPQNGLNTISLNVHTNSNNQKASNNKYPTKTNQLPIEIPTLNYITPKSGQNTYSNKHFQNL